MKHLFNRNYIMLIISLGLILSVFLISGTQLVHADDHIPYEKTFQSIEIKDGDTLLSIAQEYAISESEYTSYIEEVKNTNHLKNDTIHSGCYLLIPVYQERS